MSQVDMRRECEKHPKKAGRKYRRDAKLQELERQLEFAESRCGTLKQQLDYIKMLYRCKRETNLEKEHSKEGGHGDGSVVIPFNYTELPKWNPNFMNREDGDGPALVKQPSHSNTTTTNSSNKPATVQETRQENRKKSPKAKINVKLLKVKKKSCRKVKKKRRQEEEPSSKVSNASSQTQSNVWQDHVVEIYKNSAINAESESGLEIFGKNRITKTEEALRQRISEKLSNCKQSIEIREDIKAKSCNCISQKREGNFLREEGMQTDLPPDLANLLKQPELSPPCSNKENVPKTESVSLEPMKGYCQPTISSRRKQVEKDIYSNLTNINIRNIPFIAAKSTAPSHNIGINIQQVLSIIKKRQPLNDGLLNVNETGTHEIAAALMSSRKNVSKTNETVSAPVTGVSSSLETKRRSGGQRTSLSHWKSNSEISSHQQQSQTSSEKPEVGNTDWSLKVDKLKNVLVFLHEDFASLSQKYKRLQKKLTKRNITKTDAKDELADIERDLEKKEQEIIVVIALYKEVLNLREELKKLQKKYNFVTSGRNLTADGLRQSNSAHTQMTALLRKIQNFQEKLKG